MWSSGSQLVVSVLLAVTTACQGHVALIYPPARTYAIDFLDNARTVPPCGMAKGRCRLYMCASVVTKHQSVHLSIHPTVVIELIYRRMTFTFDRKYLSYSIKN